VEIQPVRGVSGSVENFIAVGTDITARVESEQQLRRAKAEADDASRAKSEFLASMSHEIRTPMNGVIGMTSLLMETTLTGEQRDYLQTVRDSADALLALLDDILDLSKIEARKLQVERVEFDLRQLLQDTLKILAFRSSPSVLELACDVLDATPNFLIGDPSRLRQVLTNLIGNAIKFTKKGHVIVRVRPESITQNEAVLLFSVSDTGIGIAEEKQKIIFEAFASRRVNNTPLWWLRPRAYDFKSACSAHGRPYFRGEQTGEGQYLLFYVAVWDRPKAGESSTGCPGEETGESRLCSAGDSDHGRQRSESETRSRLAEETRSPDNDRCRRSFRPAGPEETGVRPRSHGYSNAPHGRRGGNFKDTAERKTHWQAYSYHRDDRPCDDRRSRARTRSRDG